MQKIDKEENTLSEIARKQLITVSERLRSHTFLLILSKVQRLLKIKQTVKFDN